jgi:hypothetical protein
MRFLSSHSIIKGVCDGAMNERPSYRFKGAVRRSGEEARPERPYRPYVKGRSPEFKARGIGDPVRRWRGWISLLGWPRV